MSILSEKLKTFLSWELFKIPVLLFTSCHHLCYHKKLDQKLQPIYTRLDILELKQDRTMKKLDDFQLDMKVSERNINRNIHKLQDEMGTVIEVLKLHDLIPALNQ